MFHSFPPAAVSLITTLTCLMFRPQERVTNSRMPVPFTAVWLNVPQHINKSDFLPTHQTRTQDHVVHHGRRFTISLLIASDCIFMRCLLDEDSNCDQSMSQKGAFAATQQAGPTPESGCGSSPQSATISGEKPLILFDVSTAENLSTKSLIDQYSSSIRAGGEGRIADYNKMSEHFTWWDRPADELITKSVPMHNTATIPWKICSWFAGRSCELRHWLSPEATFCWPANCLCSLCCHLGV